MELARGGVGEKVGERGVRRVEGRPVGVAIRSPFTTS